MLNGGGSPRRACYCVGSRQFQPRVSPVCGEAKNAHLEFPWAKLNERLRQAFETTAIPEVYASVLRCAIRLNPDRATYDIGVSTDSLCQKLLQAHLSKSFKAVGLCFVPLFELALLKDIETLKPIEALLAEPSDMIREFAKACVDLNRLELLFKEPITTVGRSESGDTKASASSVQAEAIRYVSAEPENGSHFPAPLFAANYGTIRRILGDSRDALDKMVISWARRNDAVPFLVDPLSIGPANAKLYANVLRVGEFRDRARFYPA